MNKKKCGLSLIALGGLLVVFAFVVKQQTINFDSPAEEYAKKFGGTVYEAEAQIALFGRENDPAARAEANEIIRRGIAEKARKELLRLKAEEAKEQHFKIIIGLAAVALLVGVILAVSAKQNTAPT